MRAPNPHKVAIGDSLYAPDGQQFLVVLRRGEKIVAHATRIITPKDAKKQKECIAYTSERGEYQVAVETVVLTSLEGWEHAIQG